MIRLFLQSVATVVMPLLVLFLPGVVLVDWKKERHILAWGARVFLISLTCTTLLSYGLVFLHVPVSVTWYCLATITIIGLFIRRARLFNLPTLWYALAIILPLLIAYAAFSVPFLTTQNALPAGDSQKAIIFAQDIIDTNALPNYQTSVDRLNRDPVDFYTPGLHTVVATLMSVTPNPLTAVGFLAIAMAVTTALLGACIGKDLFETPHALFPASLVALLVLSNGRYLRYLKEPGYHLQNIVGEFWLFGLLLLLLSLIHRWRTRDAILLIAGTVALLITHQFSAFVAVFALLPAIVIFIISRRHVFWQALRTYPALLVTFLFGFVAMVIGGLALGLEHKIADIFHGKGHLAGSLPALTDYATLLGPWWLMFGLFGVVVLCLHSFKKHQNYRESGGLVGAILMILILSQGPRFGIDIPPIRALFYIVIPLSIAGAFGVAKAIGLLSSLSLASRFLATTAVCLVVLTATWSSLTSAYASLSHITSTNSSLTPELLALSEAQSSVPGGILIDDVNRRSSSWLVLSRSNMFTRIGSDIKRQMDEAKQSTLRRDIYIKQLNFEKIYSLGSLPQAQSLMASLNIDKIVGVNLSSASAFSHNPALQISNAGDDILLFKKNPRFTGKTDVLAGARGTDISSWLLKPTTLVNDIGDNEDTFKHLPVAILTTRLSAPQFTHHQTFRTTRAPYIPISFNVGDYVQALWDPANTGHPQTAVEFFIRFSHPSSSVSLQTSTGKIIGLSPLISMVELSPQDMQIDADGFVTVTLLNPREQNLAIDVVAMGPSRTP